MLKLSGPGEMAGEDKALFGRSLILSVKWADGEPTQYCPEPFRSRLYVFKEEARTLSHPLFACL